MTLHVKIDKDEVGPDTYEKLENLHTVYSDRIGIISDDICYEVFLVSTNSEEIKHFADYLNKIVKGLELYQASMV